MELPTTTVDDIENDVSISIIGCVEYVPDESNEVRTARLIDRDGDRFELTLFSQDSNYALQKGNWYIFQDAEGDVHEPTESVGITPSYGDMSVTEIDTPEIVSDEAKKIGDSLDKQNDTGSIRTVENELTRVTIDIETVRTSGITEAEFELHSSDHLELLCVGVGYQPAPGLPVDVNVLFRNDPTVQSEYDLLDAVCEWLEERQPDEVLTYHGTFDRQHLAGRAKRCDENITTEPVKTRIEPYLEDEIFRDLGMSMSLEKAADTEPTYWDIYSHSVDIPEWREKLKELDKWPDGDSISDPKVTNKDISPLGRRYLDLAEAESAEATRERRALREMLYHYTARDIEPVFSLT